MATSFTVSSVPWIAGTAVTVYPAQGWVDPGQAPSGLSAASGVVAADGTVTFANLADQARYVAWAQGSGVRFATAPNGRQASIAVPDRERIKALEDMLGLGASGGGPGPGVGPGVIPTHTADTNQAYRIIMFADGTVKAIPLDALPPIAPTGLTLNVRISSVRATWTAVSGATQYSVYRDGALITTTSELAFRDRTIAVGSTYVYTVQAIDTYGQRSDQSAPATAYIDPALNVAPTISVRTWPDPLPTTGRGIIRVNATDANAQALALALGVDTGTITATSDPSVWTFHT